jgi:hypothetical protein
MVALDELPVAAPNVNGAAAVPTSEMVCGELAALSVTVILAVRCPTACGWNDTEIVQVAFTAKVVALQPVEVKSPGFGPPGATVIMFSDAVPLLVTVIVIAEDVLPTIVDGNVRLVGASDMAGVGVPPVPDRGTACGLVVALSVTLSCAEKPPLVGAVKVMLNVQFAPAASDAGQLSISEKSRAFVPEMDFALIVRGWVPVL